FLSALFPAGLDLIQKLLLYTSPVGAIFKIQKGDFLADGSVSVSLLPELVVFALRVIYRVAEK
ncbi:TPA: hypothetical protein MA379_005161, partial [Klebsiella pneumoniae]|nr:hypothetical protein [Klebsiella pneumoniae]HBT5902561.1 hypothetical protein [Klebsiella pneumoniae]HBT5913964.1 hypothetical protein [Klebsiella pneumoniae]